MQPHPNRRALIVIGSGDLPEHFLHPILRDLDVAVSTLTFERTDLLIRDCSTGAGQVAREWWGAQGEKPGCLSDFATDSELLDYATAGYQRIALLAYPSTGASDTLACVVEAKKRGIKVVGFERWRDLLAEVNHALVSISKLPDVRADECGVIAQQALDACSGDRACGSTNR